jgi:integrase
MRMSGTPSLRMRLQYIQEFKDSKGRIRRYFRRRGFSRVVLPGAPGSVEFMTAYNAALAACKVKADHPVVTGAGTVHAVVGLYYTSGPFLSLAISSQRQRRGVLERFRREHGSKRIAGLERKHVAALLSTKPPGVARKWLTALRGLLQFAVSIGLIPSNRAANIEPAKMPRSSGYHTWREEEIAQFEAHHPIGSKPRLAMALLLFTAQRIRDVTKLGPQHVHDGTISLRQKKTTTLLTIPIHSRLAETIASTECGNLVFLTTPAGAPYKVGSLGNTFRRWCDDAGLPHCSSHGLRKAACRRLAEAGCSAPQIAAISGHKSLREVQRYIEEADRVRLAKDAIDRVEHAQNTKLSNAPIKSVKRRTSD